MLADLRAQYIIGNVLIIASGNEDDFFREATQAGNGTTGRGGDGIVIKPHAIFHSHQLNTVLHAAKILGHLADMFILHQSLYRADGSHIVFNIMDTGQQNIPDIQHRDIAPVNHTILQTNMGYLSLAGEEMGNAVAPKIGSDGIVSVENQEIFPGLMAENILFRGHILVHILMDIQMVGGQVGDHRPVGATGHVH